MEKIIKILEDFFAAEVEALAASVKPDIEVFNKKLDFMNRFVIDLLNTGFMMIPLQKPEPSEFYESYKDFPTPDKRFLFRIDEYLSDDGEILFKCFVSVANPEGWKEYHHCFIVKEENDQLKIFAKYFYSDKGMGGPKKWYFEGGDESNMWRANGEYLLNEGSLGKKVALKRLMEPSDDAESMALYNQY